MHLAGSSVLHAVSKPVARSQFSTLPLLLRAMARCLHEEGGTGLAAPQLGVPLRLFIMAAEEERGPPLVVINPQVVRSSSRCEADWESCLSVPDYGALVERPCSVKVTFTTLAGTTAARVLRGDKARVFQHEYDHLEGRLYTSRMFAPSFARLAHLSTAEERNRFEVLFAKSQVAEGEAS